MAKNIYVGNLPWSVSDEDLHQLFEEHGKVLSAQVIRDRHTKRSRGFGFVEMEDDAEAQKAIEALNGTDCDGRPLTVNEAREREERPERGDRGDRGGRPPRDSRGGRSGGYRGGGYAGGGTNRGRIY